MKLTAKLKSLVKEHPTAEPFLNETIRNLEADPQFDTEEKKKAPPKKAAKKAAVKSR